MKIGDIVKAKFGVVVFTFQKGSFNITPYGIVTDIQRNEKAGNDIFMVKIVFDDVAEQPYKADDLEVIASTNLVKPPK